MKYLLGEASPEEAQTIASWMAADPANQAYFTGLKKVWDQSRQLARQSSVDENKAWAKFQQKINGQQSQRASSPVLKMRVWLSIAAAVVILVVGVVVLNPVPGIRDNSKPMQVSSQNLVLTDTLPDGSMVTLNKNSTVSYPSKFNGKTRPVELKGEAFFNVTPDKKKPFIIKVNDVEVTVVGTSFNIRSENGVTEVIVETGIVKVAKDGQVVELKAGERTTIGAAQTTVAPPQPVEDHLYNYYRSRQFVCEQTPLWKLVQVLNEAYDANIVIGKPELGNLTLTTTFNNESLDFVLYIISETFPSIKVRKMPDQIILE